MPENENNMATIKSDEWPYILDLFDQCLGLSEQQQLKKLAETNLSKSAQTMIERMLRNHNIPFILNRTIDPLVEQLLGEEAIKEYINPAEIIGRDFGPWRAVEPLGSGGMGQVFTAERADGQYEKQVALKVIKSGHYSELSKQRFLEEMRTLAQFEHPHIAHLIDGGTSEDDIIYFIMERVKGDSIVDYAEKHKLSLVTRIQLLFQAIDAVEYAHQNLVIHGDIKPANLLVNEAGQIKLVDFGIARPVDTADKDVYLPQFTPSHSSPEQAQGKALSTASDVFGLCAVLYELCTGTAPRKQSAITRKANHTTSLNTPISPVLQRSKKQNKIINQSARQQRTLEKALSQELGAIIDKGLQLKPSDRYKNTTELRRDLTLFLNGSAVPTYANHPWYHLKKIIAKYKMPLSLLSLSIFGIVLLALYGFHQARLAQQEADKAQWTNQFLLSIFDSADPVKNQQSPITVNALTAQAANKVLNDNSNLLLKTESLNTLSQIQYRLGEVNSAQQLVTEHIRILESIKADNLSRATAHIKAGRIFEAQDNLDQSVIHFRQAIRLAPLSQDVNEQSVRAALSLANSSHRLNNSTEAERLVHDLIRNTSKIQQLDDSDSMLAAMYAMDANIMLHKQDFETAMKRLQLAKTYAAKVTGEPLLYPHILGIESDANYDHGQLNKAAELDRQIVNYFSQTFGEDHPETIDNLGRLAVSLAALGELEQAIEINYRIITNLKDTEIKGHQLPAAYLNMGTAHQALGDHNNALINYQKAQDLWPQLNPRIPIYEASTQVKMATSFLALTHYEEAQQYFGSALDLIELEYGLEHPLYARFQIMYVPLLLKLGKLEEAGVIIPKAYQTLVDTYGVRSKNAAIANLRWAQLNMALGNQIETVEQAKKVIKILDVPEYRKRNHSEIDLANKLAKSIQEELTQNNHL